MRHIKHSICLSFIILGTALVSDASVGDPQLKTDHIWYPGELAISTFPRLFAFQSSVYNRVTGRTCNNDEDKAIASWYFRNWMFYHSLAPHENIPGDAATTFYTTINTDVTTSTKPQYEVLDYWAALFVRVRVLRSQPRAIHRRDGKTARTRARSSRQDARTRQDGSVSLQ